MRTADGVERPADVLVLGTGFATHGFVAPMEIVGRGGRTLTDAWAGVPKAYLGITVAGFPNMFLLYGPNTNGGAGSVIYTVEAGRSTWSRRCGGSSKRMHGRSSCARRPPTAFDRELREALAGTVWHTGCTSWYVDEQGNNPNNWPWSQTTYRRRTSRIDPAAYELA